MTGRELLRIDGHVRTEAPRRARTRPTRRRDRPRRRRGRCAASRPGPRRGPPRFVARTASRSNSGSGLRQVGAARAWPARSRAGRAANGPTSAISSPSAAKPRRPARAGVGQCTPPSRRPGWDRSVPRRPRCRATRCRRQPERRERGRRRRGRATDSVSCQAMCGFSGLPKFRQLVSPSGSRADAGQVRGALEHGLDRPAVGVAGHAAPVAVDRDGDGGDRGAGLAVAAWRSGCSTSTAASALGRAAHRARLHDRSRTARTAGGGRRCWSWTSSASSTSRGSSVVQRRAPAPRTAAPPGGSGCEVVQRAVVDERRHRHVADDRRRRAARARGRRR